MENVIQVHGKKNLQDFKEWCNFLESLGYKNYWKDLNAKDYGIPQNRNRCFMVSILGDYTYDFPQPVVSKKILRDLLEDKVDEKYYLSKKQLEYVLDANNVALNSGRDINNRIVNPNVAKTISCRGAVDQRADVTNFVIDNAIDEISVKDLKETLGINCTKLQQEVCDKALEFMEPTDTIDYTYSNSRLKEMKQGYIKTKNSQNNTIMNTLTTNCENFGVCVDEKSIYTDVEKQLFTEDGNIKRYIDSDIVDEFKEGQMATTSFPNGYGHGPRTHNESISLNTIDKPSVKVNLRIRKLIPLEMFRLMGVKDEDFYKVAKNQSYSSLAHLAGDSIVVNVLMAIFKEML